MHVEQQLQSNHQSLRNTTLAGLAILVVFSILFLISGPFAYGAEQTRPVLEVVGLLIVAAVCAFVGLGFALHVPKTQYRGLMTVVLGLAISIRVVAIFTTPILEIDYYRYIWDGKVVCEGVSPYRFSPAAVLASGVSDDQHLNRLRALSTRSQSNHTTLSRIHYGTFTTVYPPVSQFVFAATMMLTPESVSAEVHVMAIKIVMVMFELAIILLLGWLLKMACLHPGWLIAYAWNPLVIKEIANSGHLDSIATFFVVLTVCLVVRQRLMPSVKFSKALLMLAGVTLGLGVGAKLYPVVLFPILLVAVISKSDQDFDGRKNDFAKRLFAGGVFALAFVLTSCCVLFPLLIKHSGDKAPASVVANGAEAFKNQDGFSAFFSRWRMNDPVFSTLYFNLKSDTKDSATPWFVVAPNSLRRELNRPLQTIGLDRKDAACFLARVITLSLFALFYLWNLVKLYDTIHKGEQWLVDLAGRITFVLALFLFVQPTVNPWYFVWVAPLTCLSKNRGWLLASGLLTLYYSRFWFKGLVGTFVLGGHRFDGVKLFDHIFVFVEFGLIIAVLVSFSNWRIKRQTSVKKSAT